MEQTNQPQPAKTVGSTMQAKTFTPKPAAGAAVQDPAQQETKEEKPLGVGFDAVLVAIKAGKTAQRIPWKGTMSLVGAKDAKGNIVGLNLKTGAGENRAGLHNLDILANDWTII